MCKVRLSLMRLWWVRKLIRKIFPQLPIDFSVEDAVVKHSYGIGFSDGGSELWRIYKETDSSYLYVDEEGREQEIYTKSLNNERRSCEVLYTTKKYKCQPFVECQLYEDEFEKRLEESKAKVNKLKGLDKRYRYVNQETKQELVSTPEDFLRYVGADEGAYWFERTAEDLTKLNAKYKGWVNVGE